MVESVIANKFTWLLITTLFLFSMWLFRGFIMAKIANIVPRKASDQFITMGELNAHCPTQHGREVGHLKELIETKFDHGSKQFDEIKNWRAKTDETLSGIGKTLAVIAKNGEKQ